MVHYNIDNEKKPDIETKRPPERKNAPGAEDVLSALAVVGPRAVLAEIVFVLIALGSRAG